MKKSILALSLVLFLLCINQVLAVDFDVTYKPIKDTIYPDEVAQYNLIIFNNAGNTEVYTLFSVDPSFLTKTNPISLDVPAYSEINVTLEIQPRSDTRTGPYLVPVRTISRSDEKFVDTTVFLYLKTYSPIIGVYDPAISLDLRMSDSIDPRERLPITLVFKNRNALDVKDLKVILESPVFYKEYNTSIGPLKDKTEELLFDLDPLVEPGYYKVRVYLEYNNKTISEIIKNFEVIDYSTITVEKTFERELFKTTTILNLKNVGNFKRTQTIKEPYSLLSKIFLKTEPKAKTIKEDGKRYLTWEITLSPQETRQLFITSNYRILVTIIVIIILGIIGYYILRSPILIIKQAKIHGSITEITDIKIRIILKNRTRKPVYNVKVIDKIPSIANVTEDENITGTLKPNKIIKHEHGGTLVRWDLEKLDPYEERIIVYKIKSHLKIVGGIELPSVKVRFDTGLGKERSVYSNEISISNTNLSEPNHNPA